MIHMNIIAITVPKIYLPAYIMTIFKSPDTRVAKKEVINR